MQGFVYLFLFSQSKPLCGQWQQVPPKHFILRFWSLEYYLKAHNYLYFKSVLSLLCFLKQVTLVQ